MCAIRSVTSVVLAVASAALLVSPALAGGTNRGSTGAKRTASLSFQMQVSGGAAQCLPNAKADVSIVSVDVVEAMAVHATGLPPNTNFDLFVIQVPTAPFGLSWYQGDLETNENGEGVGNFVGRFSKETFIVAPGSASAPSVFEDDASSNPETPPIQTYHLGLWFNSPDDAASAGCANTVTPFNGEHHAGIQVLNTAQFPATAGPLLQLDTTTSPPTVAAAQ